MKKDTDDERPFTNKEFGYNLYNSEKYNLIIRKDKKDPRLIILLKKLKNLLQEVKRVRFLIFKVQ